MFRSLIRCLGPLLVISTIFPLTLIATGQDIGGGRITYGETVEGAISVDVPHEEWSFRAQAGDVISARLQQSGDFDLQASIFDEYGLELKRAEWAYDAQNYVINEVYLPASGVYTISVQAYHQNESGQYALLLDLTRQVTNTLEPIENAGAINYNETVAGHLHAEEGYDTWTFFGERGDVISLNGKMVTRVDLNISLSDAADVRVAWSDWDYDAQAYVVPDFVLPTTGEYELVVAPYHSNGAGYYTLSLTLVESGGDDGLIAATGGAIEYGQLVVGQITEQIRQNEWLIEGEKGDLITIDLKNITYFQTPGLQLLISPDEVLIEGEFVPNSDNKELQIWKYELPGSGTFTIRVGFRGGDQSGYYELLVVKEGAIPTLSDGGDISLGETLGGEFTASSVEHIWAFEGQAGATITILMKRLSGNIVCDFELFNPDGSSIAFASPSANRIDAELIEFQLPVDGTYAIIARPFARNQEGIYSISISGDR